jgi:hypothetical protein
MNRREFLKVTGAAAILTPITPAVVAPNVEPMSVIKPTLKMYHNGVDTVICENINEARLLVAEQYYGKTAMPTTYGGEEIWGYYYSHYPKGGRINAIYYDEIDGMDEWYDYDMDKEFTLWEEYPGQNEETKTVKEWIEDHGRGYFASTEY